MKHDNAILRIARHYAEQGHTVFINTLHRREYNYRGLYPDIIITDGNHYPLLFIEVETNDSVNQLSVKQWQRYAATDVPLYIAVPQDSVEKAKHLCQVNDIPAHLVFSY